MIYIFNFLKNVPTRSKMTGITILLLVLLIHMIARHTHTLISHNINLSYIV